ncbi:glutamate 5-kinase [bacterium]|nr:glutamate 5-kinase [bacterium]
MWESIRNARRVVVKLGSGVLAPEGRFDRPHFARLCYDLATMREEGRQLVVVSSGAVALGVEKIGWPKRPKEIPKKQAAAAVGQSILMDRWEAGLGAFDLKVAQVLLTHDDVHDRKRYLNARRALSVLLEEGVVPIVNENDTVSVEGIKFGDNDTLAGLVVSVVEAEALIILSDVEGLYEQNPSKNPDAKLLSVVERVTPEIEALCGGAGSAVGTGGMITKVLAAKRAAELGVPTVIATGRARGVIARLRKGEEVGTFFKPLEQTLRGKRRWIAHALKPKGTLQLDAGAVEAVVERKKSLLASGIRAVTGQFEPGDAVELVTLEGGVIARGLSRYGAAEVRKIAGLKTSEIEEALGYKDSNEVVHREDLVVLA